MAVFSYSRVSTKAQVQDGESLGVQQRMIQGYAMMHGMEINQVFVEEGISGSVPLSERPQGAAMLAVLRRGDVVIGAKLDRMFRSARDALEVADAFRERGIALHLLDMNGDVTSNGISRMFFTMVSAFAEFERDRIRERVQQTKTDQRQRGRFLGGKIPFGYRVELDPIDPAQPTKKRGGVLVEVPTEQAALLTARTLRQQGATLEAIRAALIAQHGITVSIGKLHGICAAEAA